MTKTLFLIISKPKDYPNLAIYMLLLISLLYNYTVFLFFYVIFGSASFENELILLLTVAEHGITPPQRGYCRAYLSSIVSHSTAWAAAAICLSPWRLSSKKKKKDIKMFGKGEDFQHSKLASYPGYLRLYEVADAGGIVVFFAFCSCWNVNASESRMQTAWHNRCGRSPGNTPSWTRSLQGPHAFIIHFESIEHLGVNYSSTST